VDRLRNEPLDLLSRPAVYDRIRSWFGESPEILPSYAQLRVITIGGRTLQSSPVPSCAWLGNVEQHGEVVTCASAQYKRHARAHGSKRIGQKRRRLYPLYKQPAQRNPEYAVPRECVQ